jgi:hypothetical protein
MRTSIFTFLLATAFLSAGPSWAAPQAPSAATNQAGTSQRGSSEPLTPAPAGAEEVKRIKAPQMQKLLACPHGTAPSCYVYKVCDARGCYKETRCWCIVP